MGCTASNASTAGAHAVVAAPRNIKDSAINKPISKEGINVSSKQPSQNEGKSVEEIDVTTIPSLTERSRELSVANSSEKQFQIQEAHEDPTTHNRRKLTVLGTKEVPKQAKNTDESSTAKSSTKEQSNDTNDKSVETRETGATASKPKPKSKRKSNGLTRLSKRLSSASASKAPEPASDEQGEPKAIGAGGIGNGAEGFAKRAVHLPISYSAVTRPGNDPQKRRKENQDTFCVIDTFGKDTAMCVSVFDGHGPYGARASAFVRDQLPKSLLHKKIHQSDDRGFIETALHAACVEVNEQLGMSDIDVYVSGSTGVIGYLSGNRLFVANVGDSRAVLGRRSTAEGYTAVPLSTDHKPDRADEHQRIMRCGGRVFEWGVPRVWKRDVDMPGLAMARSFGDLAAESVGVFAEPEITCTELGADDAFVVLASDGLWEFLESQQVVDIVAGVLRSGKTRDVCHTAAIKCIKKAVEQWKSNEDVIDDSTVVILFLDYSSTP